MIRFPIRPAMGVAVAALLFAGTDSAGARADMATVTHDNRV
jgi:hypothetical protein